MYLVTWVTSYFAECIYFYLITRGNILLSATLYFDYTTYFLLHYLFDYFSY